MEGGIMPPWMGRLARGKRDFWRDTPNPSVSDAEGVSERIEGKAVDSDRDTARDTAVASGRAEKTA
jgi:AGZA family xanthine/uracil permease-like MFS transporter